MSEHIAQTEQQRPSLDEVLTDRLLEDQRPDLAEQYLLKALGRTPQNSKLLYKLGISLMQQNHAAGAEHCFRKLAEIEPQNLAYHCDLAACLISQGKYDQASEILLPITRDNPLDILSHTALTYLHEEQGKPRSALLCLKGVFARAQTAGTEEFHTLRARMENQIRALEAKIESSEARPLLVARLLI